jgi:hypothetical protein
VLDHLRPAESSGQFWDGMDHVHGRIYKSVTMMSDPGVLHVAQARENAEWQCNLEDKMAATVCAMLMCTISPTRHIMQGTISIQEFSRGKSKTFQGWNPHWFVAPIRQFSNRSDLWYVHILGTFLSYECSLFRSYGGSGALF